MDLDLHGRVAIITGASSNGIGRAIALQLAEEGCRIAIVARRRVLLGELAKKILKKTGNTCLIISADLTKKKSAGDIRDRVLRAYGRVDILVSAAGGSRPLTLEADDDTWEESMALNFIAVRRLGHSVLPSMLKHKWGRIISITGNSEPLLFNASHSAKAAVHAWSKGLSLVVGKSGITVNSVAPGKILTEQIVTRINPSAVGRRAFARKNIPAGYFGEPQDMANIVAFLASPRARYITGEIIHVDGGLRRHAY